MVPAGRWKLANDFEDQYQWIDADRCGSGTCYAASLLCNSNDEVIMAALDSKACLTTMRRTIKVEEADADLTLSSRGMTLTGVDCEATPSLAKPVPQQALSFISAACDN
jgi:hypothetical protein